MATLKFLSDQGYWPDLLKDVLDNGTFKSPFNVSSTKLVLKVGDLSLTIVGTGLKASDARSLSAGTISGFELRGADGLIFTETGFTSKPTRAAFQAVLDHLDGTVNNGVYNQLLVPVFFKEGLIVTGHNGFDFLRGTAGADSFDGKGDNDFIDYFSETGPNGVILNFKTGKFTDSHGNIDTVANINEANGSAKDDTFISSGATGDDDYHFWMGNAGADTYRGEAASWESVAYRFEEGPNGVVANLKTGTGTDTRGAIETFVKIDELEGSHRGDKLTGSDGDNKFVGNNGNDTIDGGKGHDQIDYRREERGGGETGVIVNLSTSSVEADIGQGSKTVAAGKARDSFGATDTLKGIEEVRGTDQRDYIRGSDNDDQLEGNDGNDTLYGLGGHDNLRGSDGDDKLYGGSGDDNFKGGIGKDLIDGGSGRDRVNYFLETPASTDTSGKHGVIVNLSTSKLVDVSITGVSKRDVAAGTAVDATSGIDTIKSIEDLETTEFQDHVVGSSSNNDFQLGAGSDRAWGGKGDDGFFGGSGNDKLYGGDGDDFFEGGSGNDLIDGGADWDKLSYGNENGGDGILANMATGKITDTYGNTDTLVGIEAVKGSRYADTFVGGSGDDNFEGLAGKDKFDGKDGGDKVDYQFEGDYGAKQGVIVNLSGSAITANIGKGSKTVAAGTAIDGFGHLDTLKSIEDIGGSQFDDVIYGANTIKDNLDGHDGDDILYGLSGDDNLRGSDGNDKLYGGSGEDFFEGGQGNDLIDGGADWDKNSYDNETGGSGIVADMATGKITDTYGDTDTIVGIEGIKGSRYSDTINGTEGDDYFEGLAGKDVFNGRGGRDHIDYQHESDFGGKQGVIVNLSSAVVTGDIGKGNKTVQAQTAVDGFGQVDRFTGIEEASGTEFTDIIHGSNNRDWIDGRDGADFLYGGGGDDRVRGGGGRDIMSGGAGNDRFAIDGLSDLGKTASTRDVITDFGDNDYIDLGEIDADTTQSGDQNFIFRTAQSSTFDGTKGQLVWFQENPTGTANDKTIVMGDVNGDKVADFHFELTGLIALNSGDFVL